MATITQCPECKSDKIVRDYEVGEIVCKNCGLIIDDISISEGPEWRSFPQRGGQTRKRVGVPISYSVHDKGLPTVISYITEDAFGRKLSPETVQQMQRLKKLQYRVHIYSSLDRNLAQAMLELDRLSSILNIPKSTQEKAALIYRRALKEDLVRGRSISAVVAATINAACRLTGTPRTLREIVKVSKVSRSEVARCYRLLVRVLNLKIPVPDPVDCVSKIASKINIDVKIQQRAIEILNLAKKMKISAGKAPSGLAAAAIYVACTEAGVHRTQREISEAAGVTEVTLRNRYKTLKEFLSKYEQSSAKG